MENPSQELLELLDEHYDNIDNLYANFDSYDGKQKLAPSYPSIEVTTAATSIGAMAVAEMGTDGTSPPGTITAFAVVTITVAGVETLSYANQIWNPLSGVCATVGLSGNNISEAWGFAYLTNGFAYYEDDESSFTAPSCYLSLSNCSVECVDGGQKLKVTALASGCSGNYSWSFKINGCTVTPSSSGTSKGYWAIFPLHYPQGTAVTITVTDTTTNETQSCTESVP